MRQSLRNVMLLLFWPGCALAANAPDGAGLWLDLLVPLLAVTIGLLAMLWWLRRGRTLSGGSRGPLKVVQAVAVGARERVVVIDAQGRRLVLGVTTQRVELIAELRNEEPTP